MAPSLPFTKSSTISARNLFGGKRKRNSSATAVAAGGTTSDENASPVNEQPLIPDWTKIQQEQSAFSSSSKTAIVNEQPLVPDWNKIRQEQQQQQQPAAATRNSAGGGDSARASKTQLLSSALRPSAENVRSSTPPPHALTEEVSRASTTARRSLQTGVSFALDIHDERLIPSRNTPAYLREQQQQQNNYFHGNDDDNRLSPVPSNAGRIDDRGNDAANNDDFGLSAADARRPDVQFSRGNIGQTTASNNNNNQIVYTTAVSAVAIVHKTLSTTTLKDEQQQLQTGVVDVPTLPLREYNSSNVNASVRAEPTTPVVDYGLPSLRTSSSTTSAPPQTGIKEPVLSAQRKATVTAENRLSVSSKASLQVSTAPNNNVAGSLRKSDDSSTIPIKSEAGTGYDVAPPHSSSRKHRIKKPKALMSSGGTSTTAEGLQTEDITQKTDATGNDAAPKYRTIVPTQYRNNAAVASAKKVTDGQQTNLELDENNNHRFVSAAKSAHDANIVSDAGPAAGVTENAYAQQQNEQISRPMHWVKSSFSNKAIAVERDGAGNNNVASEKIKPTSDDFNDPSAPKPAPRKLLSNANIVATPIADKKSQQFNTFPAENAENKPSLSASKLSSDRILAQHYSATALADDRIKESIMALYVDRPAVEQTLSRNRIDQVRSLHSPAHDELKKSTQKSDNNDDVIRDTFGAQQIKQQALSRVRSTNNGDFSNASRPTNSSSIHTAVFTQSAPNAPTFAVMPAAEDDEENNNNNNNMQLTESATALRPLHDSEQERVSTAWAADSIRRIYSSTTEQQVQQQEQAFPDRYDDVVAITDDEEEEQSTSSRRAWSRDARSVHKQQPKKQPYLEADASSLSNLSMTSSTRDGPKTHRPRRANEDDEDFGAIGLPENIMHQNDEFSKFSPATRNAGSTRAFSGDHDEYKQTHENVRDGSRHSNTPSSIHTVESDMGKRYAQALLDDCPEEFRPIEAKYVVQRFVRDNQLVQEAGKNSTTILTKQKNSSAAQRAPLLTTTPPSNVQLLQNNKSTHSSRNVANNNNNNNAAHQRAVYLAGAQSAAQFANESTMSNSGSNAVSSRLAALTDATNNNSVAGTTTTGTARTSTHRTPMSYPSSATLGISAADARDENSTTTLTASPITDITSHTVTTTMYNRLVAEADRGSGDRFDDQPSFRTGATSRDVLGEDESNNDNTTLDEDDRRSDATTDDEAARNENADAEFDEEMLRGLADARQISVARFLHPQPVNSNNSIKNAGQGVSPAHSGADKGVVALGQQQSTNTATMLQPRPQQSRHSNASSTMPGILQIAASRASGESAYRDMQHQQQQQPVTLLENFPTSANPSYRDFQLERLNEMVNINETLNDTSGIDEIALAASVQGSSLHKHQPKSVTPTPSPTPSRGKSLPHFQLISASSKTPSQHEHGETVTVKTLKTTNLNVPLKSRSTKSSNAASSGQRSKQHSSTKSSAKSVNAAASSNRSMHEKTDLDSSRQPLMVYHSSVTNMQPGDDFILSNNDDDEATVAFKEVGSGDFSQIVRDNYDENQQQQLPSFIKIKSRNQSISNAAAATAVHTPRAGRSKPSFKIGSNSSNAQSVAATEYNVDYGEENQMLQKTPSTRSKLPSLELSRDNKLTASRSAHANSEQHLRSTPTRQASVLQQRAATSPRLTETPGFNVSTRQPSIIKKTSSRAINYPSETSQGELLQHRSDNVLHMQQNRSQITPSNNNIASSSFGIRSTTSNSEHSISFEARNSRTLLGVVNESGSRENKNKFQLDRSTPNSTSFATNLAVAGSTATTAADRMAALNNDDEEEVQEDEQENASSSLKVLRETASTSSDHARRITALLRPPGLLRTQHTFDEQVNILRSLHCSSPTENVVSHAILEHANVNAAFGSRIYPQPKARISYEALQLPSAVVRLVESSTGANVFLFGVERFNDQDVVRNVRDLIEQTLPDIVFVQLGAELASARSRRSVTSVSDPSGKTVSELYVNEARSPLIRFNTVARVLSEHGYINGLLHLLYLDLESIYTRRNFMPTQLAFREAVTLGDAAPFCDVVFGDRASDLTFRRAYSVLNIFDKFYLLFRLIFAHMQGDGYLALTSLAKIRRVLIDERDKFMCASLQYYAQSLIRTSEGMMPLTVVGIVGVEHVIGIKHYWRRTLDIRPLQCMPPPYGTDEVVLRKVAHWTPLIAGGTLCAYVGYKTLQYGIPVVRNFYRSLVAR